MSRPPGFTLVEVMVSITLVGIILTAAYTSFQGILRSQVKLTGQTNIQKGLLYLNEKIAQTIKNGGTIDYEEYFNRRMLGYTQSFSDSIWTFSTSSHFGNGDGTATPIQYFCGKDSKTNEEACLANNSVSIAPDTTTFTSTLAGKHLAYGQYRDIGFNYQNSAGFPVPQPLPSIFPVDSSTSTYRAKGFPELYLIRELQDTSFERTYIRHIFIDDPYKSTTCNPSVATTGCIGKLQMTKLVSCDTITVDGQVDAWVPHPDFGGSASPCSSITSASQISSAANALEWVDITGPDLDVRSARFLPTPLKFPELMAGVGEQAYAPLLQIRLEVALSTLARARGNIHETDNQPKVVQLTVGLE